jgi:hypothetical protein
MLDPIKLEAFRSLLERDQLTGLVERQVNCEANRMNCKVTTRPGAKYTKVDIGDSGRYMIVNETGEIFGIKGYGVIHRGHAFGTLDTIHDWNWSDYRAFRIPVTTENLNACRV